MKIKRENNISESQIEDALVANLVFLAKTLKLPADVRLIARQLRLKSSEERTDLLLSSGKNLCLVEMNYPAAETAGYPRSNYNNLS